MNAMVTFSIFDKLGGRDACVALLGDKRGKPLTRHAVEKWVANKRLPPWVSVALMEECQARGIPFDLSDCAAQMEDRNAA